MKSGHKKYEDLAALLLCSLLVSLGITFLKEANLVTGGIAGLTLYLSQVTGFSFGTLFFVLNMPFYLIAYKRMGKSFTLNTLVAVSVVSIFTDKLNMIFTIEMVNPLYAACAGGTLIGIGMLIIFRHGMSLGGFNILVLFIQDRLGINAGKFQLVIDSAVVLLSLTIIEPLLIFFSVISVAIVNLILAMNHIPGRYKAQPHECGS